MCVENYDIPTSSRERNGIQRNGGWFIGREENISGKNRRERFGGTKIEGILFGEKTWWEVFCAKFLTGNQIFFIKTSNEIKIQYNYN
jgi:hypothetical protein